jgi:hypothetical protein
VVVRRKVSNGLNSREGAVEVESGGRRVAGAVTFASRLGPDDGVNGREPGVDRRALSEPGTFDVAPVTPLLAEVLLARATLVDDEVGGESSRRQNGSERLENDGLKEAGFKNLVEHTLM